MFSEKTQLTGHQPSDMTVRWQHIRLIVFLEDLMARFVYPALSQDEKRRRSLFMLISTISFAVAIIATTRALWNTGVLSPETWLSGGGIIAGIGCLIAGRQLQQIDWLYFLSVLYYGITILYSIFIGADNGTSYLWLYIYPAIAYSLLGATQGIVIILATWLVALVIIVFNVGFHPYSTDFGIPFLLSYTLTALFAYGIEVSRMRYYHQLQAEKTALQEVLDKVHTLETLLPICASCKKIRDDNGDWQHIENYISDHSSIAFSHGICPDCRAKLFMGR